MTTTAAQTWEAKRTDETRLVENVLLNAGFEHADAYRYNPASIRVRVVDSRFEGLATDGRDAMIEPVLDQLPERTQGDIVSLFSFAPSELGPSKASFREVLLNAEFEDPSPSVL